MVADSIENLLWGLAGAGGASGLTFWLNGHAEKRRDAAERVARFRDARVSCYAAILAAVADCESLEAWRHPQRLIELAEVERNRLAQELRLRGSELDLIASDPVREAFTAWRTARDWHLVTWDLARGEATTGPAPPRSAEAETRELAMIVAADALRVALRTEAGTASP